MEELKAECLVQLIGMSKKRIRYVLEGMNLKKLDYCNFYTFKYLLKQYRIF